MVLLILLLNLPQLLPDLVYRPLHLIALILKGLGALDQQNGQPCHAECQVDGVEHRSQKHYASQKQVVHLQHVAVLSHEICDQGVVGEIRLILEDDVVVQQFEEEETDHDEEDNQGQE